MPRNVEKQGLAASVGGDKAGHQAMVQFNFKLQFRSRCWVSTTMTTRPSPLCRLSSKFKDSKSASASSAR